MAPAAPAPDLALYVGPAGNVLSDGTALVPHETVVAVGRGEAEESAYWEPIEKPTKAEKAGALS